MNKTLRAALCLLLIFVLSSCGSNEAALYTANEKFAESGFEQLKPPEKGEEIVVISTSMGDIKVRLFPQYAPNAVENFKGLAEKNYYDNLIFHRVIEQFVIQGGDPNGNGTGGESLWGGTFSVEIDPNLHHIRGALAMARGESYDSQGSQFYIVCNDDVMKGIYPEEIKAELEYLLENQETDISGENEEPYYIKDLIPSAFIESYLENGGTYSLDFNYTVFGQVFAGMEVVDKISRVSVNNEKPIQDVVIKSVRVEKYDG